MVFRLLLSLGLALSMYSEARAGFFEASIGGSYNRSNYDGGSQSSTRRMGGSLGYNFSDASTIEFSYQVSEEKNHLEGYQDAKYEDQVYSVNWVQNFATKQSTFQPYAKLGVGQLNREATVSLVSGQSQNTQILSVTAVGGLGLRIYLTKAFALRFEGTSYLLGARIKTWNQNFGITAGGSLFF